MERCHDCTAPMPERADGDVRPDRRCESCWWTWQLSLPEQERHPLVHGHFAAKARWLAFVLRRREIRAEELEAA